MVLFGSIQSHPTVRISAIFLALVGLLVLPGCWVRSVNGLSEAEFFGSTDKDQTFDSGLLGMWTATSEDCVTTLNVTSEVKEYHWKMTTGGKGCDNDIAESETDYYEGELFKLDDHKFLDLTARTEDVCRACVAVHWIFKINMQNDSLDLAPIDGEWLEKAEKERTVTLATAHGDHDTLTASPKELKEFCRKYADDGNVFKPSADYTFKRKQP
jgi:hypothetical protein